MDDPLDTEEGRALVDAAREAGRVFDNSAGPAGSYTVERFFAEVVRAILAATNEHGESIVVLRSRLERLGLTRYGEAIWDEPDGIDHNEFPVYRLRAALPDNTEGK